MPLTLSILNQFSTNGKKSFMSIPNQDENHPTGNCTNPYGKTKYIMEEIIKDVCFSNKVNINLFENLSI